MEIEEERERDTHTQSFPCQDKPHVVCDHFEERGKRAARGAKGGRQIS